MELQRNTHYIYRLMYQFFWIPKYRHKIFVEPYREAMRAIIHNIAYDFDIQELAIQEDHIHMVSKANQN